MKWLTAIVLLTALSGPQVAVAERELVDRVVAVVDDHAIFASDIDAMVKQFAIQQGKTSFTQDERAELEQRMLQDLIGDRLIIAQADRLGIDIPFAEVEKEVDRAIEENRNLLGGQEPFERQLEREGFTMESLKRLYRQQVRNRMLVQRVLEAEVDRGGTQVTDEELRRYFQEKKTELPPRPAVVNLRTIFLSFGASTNASDAARARIEEVHRRLQAGEAFAELAREYSEDPSAPNGGDLGFVKPSDLVDPAFSEAVAKLDVGDISEPVQTEYGYHVVTITEKNPDSGEVRVSHILVRVTPTDDDMREVFERATSIHEKLMAGAPFDSMAAEYSDDPTAGQGGDLGWLKLGDLPEFFRDVLSGMQPGDISQVLRESNGFRIVKLVDREDPRPYAYEEVRGELQKMYEQERMSLVYNEYLESLREKFTVEIR